VKATKNMKLRLNKDTLVRLSDRELSFAAGQTGECIVESVTTPIFKCC
jgi:hypothetical protein